MDPLDGELMDIWTGSVANSTIEYQQVQAGLDREKVPSIHGVEIPRLNIEKDVLLNDKDLQSTLQNGDELKIQFNGRRYSRRKIYNGEWLDDPCKDDDVLLSPVEVRYHPMVIEKMRSVSVEIATDSNGEIVPKETGGYLGGKVLQDKFGRWYTYVTHVEADSKYDAGTSNTFEYTTQMQHEMIANILQLELYPVGFWHSHPTYQPFQSDSRLNSQYGNDVQTTYNICTQWWEVAAVIDPFGPSSIQSPNGDVSLGNYKINGIFDDATSYEKVGWRSISTGIIRIPSWNFLEESSISKNAHEIELRNWEKQYYIRRVKEVLENKINPPNLSSETMEGIDDLVAQVNSTLHFGKSLDSKEAKKIITLILEDNVLRNVTSGWQENLDWSVQSNSGNTEEE